MTSPKTVTPDQPQAVPDAPKPVAWVSARDLESFASAADHNSIAICDVSSSETFGFEAPLFLAARPVLPVETPAEGLQERVRAWTFECFGDEIACDVQERLDRFAEEAIELTQAVGYSRERWYALIAYVFDREPGDPPQEVGGTMTTLAALCNTQGIDIISAWRAEVARITQPEMVLKIRAKQAAKPTGSALPVALPATAPAPLSGRDGSLREALEALADAKGNTGDPDCRRAIERASNLVSAALAAAQPETAEMEKLTQAFRKQADKLADEMELNLRLEGRLIAAEIKAESAAEDERDRLYEKAMSLNDHEAGLFLNHVGAMLCADRLAARASSSGEAGDA